MKSKTPKPIVLVRIPRSMMEMAEALGEFLAKKMTDYHVIPTIDFSIEEIQIEVFYEKDWKQSDIDEIQNHINNLNKNQSK